MAAFDGATVADATPCCRRQSGSFCGAATTAPACCDIIRQVGGSRRAIYEEFGDKRGLFTAAVQEVCRGGASAPDQARAFELPPEQALRIFGQRLLEVLMSRETLALYRMLLGEVGRFPALGRLVFNSVPESAAKHLAVYLKEQTKLGVLDVKNPARAAWVFMEMLQGDVHLKALLNPRGQAQPPPMSASPWRPPLNSFSMARALEFSLPVTRAELDLDSADDHLAITTRGFPFSTIYVASSEPLPLPTFFAPCFTPAGMNRTSPALSLTAPLPSTWYSHTPSST